MEFLKQHYEKVILSVVLLGLVVAAAYLPFEVAKVREELAALTGLAEDPRAQPLPDLNLTTNELVFERLNRPINFGFGKPGHGLFTPAGTWRKGPGGVPQPPPPQGLESFTVTQITPLQLRIDFQSVASQAPGQIRYSFSVKNQAASQASLQRGRIVTRGVGEKPDVILVKEVKGPPENPEAFLLEVVDLRLPAVVSKDKPFVETVGYQADLRHEREKRDFRGQRQGSKINVGGATYNVVAISATDVTIEDDRTKRRTVVSLKPAP